MGKRQCSADQWQQMKEQSGASRTRGRRSEPTAEAKLKRWGDVEGQDSLFEDEELLTPEIKEWRSKH